MHVPPFGCQANVEDLLAKKIDGLIFSGGPLGAAPEAVDAAKAAHVPVVVVDR
jgi:ABC-type sugar transport system substrate-binding protein